MLLLFVMTAFAHRNSVLMSQCPNNSIAIGLQSVSDYIVSSVFQSSVPVSNVHCTSVVPGRAGQSHIDLIVTGMEASLWVAEQFALDLKVPLLMLNQHNHCYIMHASDLFEDLAECIHT